MGATCPLFVAGDVKNLPISTVESFDLHNISNKVSTLLNLESEIKSAFAAISCLQTDFKIVIEKCSEFGNIANEIADIKLRITEANAVTAQETNINVTEGEDKNKDRDTDEQHQVDFDDDSRSSISCESSDTSDSSGADEESDSGFHPLPP